MEKIKTVVLLAVMAFPAVPASSGTSYGDYFTIHMKVQEIERSKDSHTTTYEIKVIDTEMSFSRSYHGAHLPNSGEEFVVDLSQERVDNLIKMIFDLGLAQSDTAVNDKNIVGNYFTCNLDIKIGSENYSILIDGAEDHFDNEGLVTSVKKLFKALKLYAGNSK